MNSEHSGDELHNDPGIDKNSRLDEEVSSVRRDCDDFRSASSLNRDEYDEHDPDEVSVKVWSVEGLKIEEEIATEADVKAESPVSMQNLIPAFLKVRTVARNEVCSVSFTAVIYNYR